jgi:hypothetical protein
MSKTTIFAIVLILCGERALAQKVSAPMPQQAKMQAPCAADNAKYCKDVQPGNGRIIDCLALHKARL